MLTEKEILKFIEDDDDSVKKKAAKIGLRYYEAEHDIQKYRMFFFNADGNLVEDTQRANAKISHPFFTELVDQEVQYMLSGKNGFVKSDVPELQKELDEYFGEDFTAELSNVLTGTIVKGFDYMYAYTNQEGKLAFQHADSMGVIEVRAKDADDGSDYIIYWYVDRLAKKDKHIKRIQVWDKEKICFYIQEDGKLKEDRCFEPYPGDERSTRPHTVFSKGEDVFYESFGFIPFFRLDNSTKQQSGLAPIKSLIDDYDIMSCGLSNNLADFDHPLHVVKGFQGDNLDELAHNLRTKKMIGVDDTGGVEVHTVDIPYQARLVKMQEDEKNIYRFGMGFNSSQIGDGNITNIVIKSRYALLDLKCNKLEIRLRQFLRKILKVVLSDINRLNETDYQMSDVWFDFEREVMTNAADNAQIEKTDTERKQIEVNTVLSLQGILDDESIIRAVCETLELDYDEIKNRLPDDEELINKQILSLLESGGSP